MYLTFRDAMAVIDEVIMKSRHVIISDKLKMQALDELHVNHMGIEKTKLLASESIYWVNINDDIENYVKIVLHALHFSRHNQRTR